jgi:transcriptional/translational regulatory protein YebC/TACO1
VECLTDNPNRTFGDVRQCFTKTNTKIGTPGVVSHMFDHSIILVFKGDEEAVLEALVAGDVDVSDIESDGGNITVFAPPTEYAKAKQALAAAFGEIEYEVDEIQFIPQNYIQLTGDDAMLFEKFVNLLDDVEDVQRVFHNVE